MFRIDLNHMAQRIVLRNSRSMGEITLYDDSVISYNKYSLHYGDMSIGIACNGSVCKLDGDKVTINGYEVAIARENLAMSTLLGGINYISKGIHADRDFIDSYTDSCLWPLIWMGLRTEPDENLRAIEAVVDHLMYNPNPSILYDTKNTIRIKGLEIVVAELVEHEDVYEFKHGPFTWTMSKRPVNELLMWSHTMSGSSEIISGFVHPNGYFGVHNTVSNKYYINDKDYSADAYAKYQQHGFPYVPSRVAEWCYRFNISVLPQSAVVISSVGFRSNTLYKLLDYVTTKMLHYLQENAGFRAAASDLWTAVFDEAGELLEYQLYGAITYVKDKLFSGTGEVYSATIDLTPNEGDYWPCTWEEQFNMTTNMYVGKIHKNTNIKIAHHDTLPAKLVHRRGQSLELTWFLNNQEYREGWPSYIFFDTGSGDINFYTSQITGAYTKVYGTLKQEHQQAFLDDPTLLQSTDLAFWREVMLYGFVALYNLVESLAFRPVLTATNVETLSNSVGEYTRDFVESMLDMGINRHALARATIAKQRFSGVLPITCSVSTPTTRWHGIYEAIDNVRESTNGISSSDRATLNDLFAIAWKWSTKEWHDNRDATTGMRLSKLLRKEHGFADKRQQEVISMVIQKLQSICARKHSRAVRISTDFTDMLMASVHTKGGWSSCFNWTRNEDDERGCYGGGPAYYAGDYVTAIAYTFNASHTSNPEKASRAWVYFHQDLPIAYIGRIFPNHSEAVLTQYIIALSIVLAKLHDIEDSSSVKVVKMGSNYQHDDYSLTVMKGVYKDPPEAAVFFGDISSSLIKAGTSSPICVGCGGKEVLGDFPACESCASKSSHCNDRYNSCEDCGNTSSHVVWVESADAYLCPDCYFICDSCHRVYANRDVHVVIDECQYCSVECAIDAGFDRCECCDDWFLSDDVYDCVDLGKYCCKYCAPDLYFDEESGEYYSDRANCIEEEIA